MRLFAILGVIFLVACETEDGARDTALAPRHEGTGISATTLPEEATFECSPPKEIAQCIDEMYSITPGSVSYHISSSDFAAIVDIDYDYTTCAPLAANGEDVSVPVTELLRFNVEETLKDVVSAPATKFFIGGCCDQDGLCCFEPGCFPGHVWSGKNLVIGQYFCGASTPQTAYIIINGIYPINDTQIFDRRGVAQSWSNMKNSLAFDSTSKTPSLEFCEH